MSIADRARNYYKSQTTGNSIASRAANYFANQKRKEEEQERLEAEQPKSADQRGRLDLVQAAYGQRNTPSADFVKENDLTLVSRTRPLSLDARPETRWKMDVPMEERRKQTAARRAEEEIRFAFENPIEAKERRSALPDMDPKAAKNSMIPNNMDRTASASAYLLGQNNPTAAAWYTENATDEERAEWTRLMEIDPGLADKYVTARIMPKVEQYVAQEQAKKYAAAAERAEDIATEENWFWRNAKQAWLALEGGAKSAFTVLANRSAAGTKYAPDYTSEAEIANQMNIARKAQEGDSTFALEALTGLGNMLPSVALGPAAGGALMATQAYSGAYLQAKEDGANDLEANLHGMVVGGFEYALSKVLGGVSALAGKTNLGKAGANLANWVSSKMTRNAATKVITRAAMFVGRTAPEFLEESIQTVVDNLSAKVFYGQDIDWSNLGEDALKDGLLGLATAGILNLATSPRVTAARRNQVQLETAITDENGDIISLMPKPIVDAIVSAERNGSVSKKQVAALQNDLTARVVLAGIEPSKELGISRTTLNTVRRAVGMQLDGASRETNATTEVANVSPAAEETAAPIVSDAAQPVIDALLANKPISGNQANKVLDDIDALRYAEDLLGVDTSTENTISGKRAVLVRAAQHKANTPQQTIQRAVRSTVKNWNTKRDETNKQKTMYSLSEIVRTAAHIFGVSPRIGSLSSDSSPGEFNRQTGSVRLAEDNDLPVLMHEFGHMMDKRLRIHENAPEAVRNELIKNFGQKDKYTQEEWLGEGIAEFARELITSPEAAQTKYPQSYRYLMAQLSPSMQKALFETLAPAVNTYLSADLDARALAAIKANKDRLDTPWIVRHSETARKIYDWFGDNSFKDWWISNITDDLYGIDKASRELGIDMTAHYKLALNSRTSIRGRTEAAMSKGLTDIDGNIIGRSFESCFEPVLAAVDARHDGKRALGEWMNDYKQTMDEFGLYLICCRGVDIRKGKHPKRRIFADKNLDSLKYMQSVVYKAPPEFREAAKRIYEFLDKQIDMRVAAGLMTEEEAAAWRKAYPHYVPFERDIRGGKVNPTKPMVGSTKDFNGVFQAIAKITANTIAKTTQNTIRRDILQTITSLSDSAWFATRNPDADIEIVAPVETDENAVWNAYEHGRKDTQWDVGVYENGKRISYTVNDKPFFIALESLTHDTTKRVLPIIKSLNSIFTATVTGKNLPWNITSNLPRDLQTMGLSFDKGEFMDGIRNYGKSIFAIDNEKQGEDIRKFFILTSGGSELSSTLFKDQREIKLRKRLATADLKGFEKQKAKFLLGDIHPFSFITTVADYIETRARIAAFLTARQNGKNIQEAIYESQDITTNFGRHGKLTKSINGYIPFFNAGVQGLSKSFRNMTGYKNAYESGGQRAKRAKAYWIKSALFAVIASTFEAVVSMALWRGDEEERKKAQDSWTRLSTYHKNNAWNFYIGDDTYISLKKPRELGILPSALGRLAETIITENADAWYDFGSYSASQLLPPLIDVLPVMAEGMIAGEDWSREFVGGLLSSAGFFGNVVGALANVDYRGNEIVPSSVSNKLAKEQYTDQTTKVAKIIGDMLNLSPMQVDYALQNFGILQNINEAFFTNEDKSFLQKAGSFFAFDGLTKNSTRSTDITTIFYDNRDFANRYASSYSEDVGAAVEAKEYNSMASFYSAFNNLQKNEPESDEKQTARRTVLDMLAQFNDEMENGYDKQVIDLMHQFSEDVAVWNTNERSEDETELSPTGFYPATMGTVIDDTQLTSEQYYVYQTVYLDAYYTAVAEVFADGKGSVKNTYKYLNKAKEKAKKQADNYMAEYLNLTGGK